MTATTRSSQAYRALGIAVIAVFAVCALLGVAIATPYFDAHDQVLGELAIGLGLFGGLMLTIYMAWTLTVTWWGWVSGKYR